MELFCFYESKFKKDIKQYKNDLEELLGLDDIEISICEPRDNPSIVEYTNLKVFVNDLNNNSIIVEFFKNRKFEYIEQKIKDRLIFTYLN